MKKYRFQIQNTIDIEVEAENEIEARLDIVDNISRYADMKLKDLLNELELYGVKL